MSASSSEVLASAIKGNSGGALIGETTFGKGVIQDMFKISNQGEAVKITVQEYFGPNKSKINGVGVEPDYEVSLKPDDETDYQLEKAIEILKKMY